MQRSTFVCYSRVFRSNTVEKANSNLKKKVTTSSLYSPHDAKHKNPIKKERQAVTVCDLNHA